MEAKLGIVTGIRLEENLLIKTARRGGHDAPLTACACGTVDGARAAAQSLIEQGASHLISFGVCGALDPDLKAGDLILADKVSMDGQSLPIDAAWHARIMASFPQGRAGQMLSVAAPITAPQDKKAAYETTGAIAVDVESFAVARAASEAGLPCLALRAVLDNAAQSLPEAAVNGVDADGQTQIWPVIKGLIRRPQDLPALMALGRDSGRAQTTLRGFIKKGALKAP